MLWQYRAARSKSKNRRRVSQAPHFADVLCCGIARTRSQANFAPTPLMEGSTLMPRRRRTEIGSQFVARTREVLESYAYRTLSLSARRLLDRIELENMYHGGAENGRLPVTYRDFVAYGIDGHAVGPAIREAVALGFLEVTERGCAGNAEFRSPNKFRLTYLPTHGVTTSWGKGRWELFDSLLDAKNEARRAREERSNRAYRPQKTEGKKQKSNVGKHPNSMVETHTENGDSIPVKPPLLPIPGN